MRMFDLYRLALKLQVSQHKGALVSLIGIDDAEGLEKQYFRKKIKLNTAATP